MSDGPEATPHPDAAARPDTPPAEAASQTEEPAEAPALERPAADTRPPGWLPALNIPLSRVQVLVGLTAGLLSISGFLYPALRASRAPLPLGEVVTLVHELGSRLPVTDATVEILTPGHVLVTTLTPRDEGRARHVIKEGTYRVRVSHPQFALETRSIQVLAGTIAEIRFQLTPRRGALRSPAAAEAASPPGNAAATAPVPAPASRPTTAAGPAPRAAAPDVRPAERQREGARVRRPLLREPQSP